MERWLAMWKHRGLDLPAGTIFDGLRRIALLLKPIHDAIWARTASGGFTQADETRWLMVSIRQRCGREAHRVRSWGEASDTDWDSLKTLSISRQDEFSAC